ncbi:hypothetical protein AYK86_16345, partial [Acinetobacter venetianus]|uniref:hypothetical protein n=1 Tax=Acinetobacter venetianus TaxID=52133 RepID=UPI000775C417
IRDSEGGYNNLTKIQDYIVNLSSDFYEFYKIGNNQFDSIQNIQQKYLDFTEQKTKELEILFGSFESKIKSAQSMYTITSDDLEGLHKDVLEINKNLNLNYNKMREVEKNINEFKSIYDAQVLKFRNELDFRINEIENIVRIKSNDKLNIFLKEIDSSTILMKSEFDEIKNTTKKFSEFMSDETSTKLTNDFKSKAETEMIAYYGFTALSFVIIFVAILISWNTLHTFADAHIGDGKNYNNLDLIYLSIRLIFSLIVFLSVTYTSKLASKSYTYWKKNEGIFLRLTALKSFIADMSETKKEEIHEKLVDVYFGKDDQDNNLNSKLKDLPNNITQLLGKVVEQSSVVFDSTKQKKEVSSSSSDNKND